MAASPARLEKWGRKGEKGSVYPEAQEREPTREATAAWPRSPVTGRSRAALAPGLLSGSGPGLAGSEAGKGGRGERHKIHHCQPVTVQPRRAQCP